MARRPKLPSESAILRHLSESRKGPLKAKELAKALSVSTKHFRDFRTLLFEMVDRGRIYRVKGQRFAVPEKINLVVGRLSVTSKGDGFVKPDAGGQEVFVPGLSLESAMDGDQVVTRVESRPRGRSPVGRVIKVLERAHETLVGTYQSTRPFGVVHPQNRKIHREVLVVQGEENGAADGDVVVVRLTTFGSGKMNPTGTIETVLGKAGDPGVDVLAVIHGHGLPIDFPHEGGRCERRLGSRAIRALRDLRALSPGPRRFAPASSLWPQSPRGSPPDACAGALLSPRHRLFPRGNRSSCSIDERSNKRLLQSR